jgi:beta-lactam-binding protein with PASTA domain
MKNESKDQKSFFQYLISKDFLKQLLFLAAVFLGIILLANLWLRFYTNHGQKITLPNFVGSSMAEAQNLAEHESFELVVMDSVFALGKSGGIIMDQNPKAKSLVKEGRKIYVTITKYNKETVNSGDLPTLYGNPFEQKKSELKYRDIECVVKDYAYDPGAPDHILEVYYKGELIISKDVRKSDVVIFKGDKLECILSRSDGGDVIIPNLMCLEMTEVEFMLSSNKLLIGTVTTKGTPAADAPLYVISQSPQSDGTSTLKMGEKISVTLSPTKPNDCE